MGRKRKWQQQQQRGGNQVQQQHPVASSDAFAAFPSFAPLLPQLGHQYHHQHLLHDVYRHQHLCQLPVHPSWISLSPAVILPPHFAAATVTAATPLPLEDKKETMSSSPASSSSSPPHPAAAEAAAAASASAQPMGNAATSQEGNEGEQSSSVPLPPLPPVPLANACEDNWSWNPEDRSHEVRLYGPRKRIAHFHPNWSNGTAGVRGTRTLHRSRRYYWEVCVSQRIFGTSMMFGVGTRDCRLHVDAFVNMLGEDERSWGLSHKGFLWHAGKNRMYTKPFRENVATTIGLYFDGPNGTLTYYKDGASLGVAFTGLDKATKEPLYPVVCSTAAKTEMALGVMKRDFTCLQDRCRSVVLAHLQEEEHIDTLPLPRSVMAFLREGLEDFQAEADLSRNNAKATQQNSNSNPMPSSASSVFPFSGYHRQQHL